MLAIRMQRTGRKGYPTYRVIVQEAHRQPTSGRVVANIGSYNPHTKEVNLNKERAEFYLKNGAQPSERVVKVFESEKIKLPDWVKSVDNKKQKAVKNPEKLRRNQPAEPAKVEGEDATEAEVVVDETQVQEPNESNNSDQAEESIEQIADKEVADGQVTAEEEVAAEADAESTDVNADAEDQAEKPAE